MRMSLIHFSDVAPLKTKRCLSSSRFVSKVLLKALSSCWNNIHSSGERGRVNVEKSGQRPAPVLCIFGVGSWTLQLSSLILPEVPKHILTEVGALLVGKRRKEKESITPRSSCFKSNMLARAVLASFWAGLVSAAVLCPDGRTCPDQRTCCLTKGGYGCCSYPSAICCSNEQHCCPAGYNCNDAVQSCVKDGLPWLRLPWHRTTPAMTPKATLPQILLDDSDNKAIQEMPSDVSVVYCDNIHYCPDGTTCCKNPYGVWSCCIYPVGSCCRDGVHCCPYGSHCDYTSSHCLRGGLRINASPQLPALRSDEYQVSSKEPKTALLELSPLTSDDNAIQKSRSDAVVRCDSLYYCPEDTTCCKSPYGTWSCCRTLLGSCCRDGKHCCPHGYHCDITSSQCLMGGLAIASTPQLPAIRYDEHKDPCCLSEAGCCQVGFQCDRDLRTCVRDFAGPVPWATLIQAPGDGSLALSGVIRCNGRLYCPAGNSCCQSVTGEWGCCPYPLGQCCSDGKHCCNYKWKCDEASMNCVKGDTYIPSASMRDIQRL